MKKPAGTERHPNPDKKVLSVGSLDQDYAELSRIFASAHWPLIPGSKWTLETRPDLGSALSVLNDRATPLETSDSDLGLASWRDFWTQAASLPDPPFLIVTSRIADE